MTFSRETSHHEAGHAILAHILGLEVQEIRVNADDEGGGTDVCDCTGRLSFINQLALCFAGHQAQRICKCLSPPGHPGGLDDRVRAYQLLKDLSRRRAKALRMDGHQRAYDLLLPQKLAIEHVAQKLMECGKLSGDEFRELVGPAGIEPTT
jgi:hypothetical protein